MTALPRHGCEIPAFAGMTEERASVKRACKPDSVPRLRGGGHLSGPPVAGRDRAAYPGTAAGRCAPQGGDVPLFGLAPGGVCQHPGLRRDLVRSYRTVSRLPVLRVSGAIGAIVSVALSVASLRLGVTQHPARRSPDFPPRRCRSGRPALLTCSVYACEGVLPAQQIRPHVGDERHGQRPERAAARPDAKRSKPKRRKPRKSPNFGGDSQSRPNIRFSLT